MRGQPLEGVKRSGQAGEECADRQGGSVNPGVVVGSTWKKALWS